MEKRSEKKRVLMVIPNQRWSKRQEWSIHPYAVCSLIAMIRDQYEVGFLDANVDDLSLEMTKSRIKEFAPDVVGISVLANAYKTSGFKVCEIAKEVDPKITTVIGGVFVTTRPKVAMECAAVDYGVMGEGEYVFVELLEYIFGVRPTPPKSGIILRTPNGLDARPQLDFIRTLEALPLPDYSLVDYRKYSNNFRKSVDAPRALPYGKIMTSRGCPIGCVFCQVEDIMGKITRFKSVDRVIQEIQYLIDKFGIRALEFDDDNLLGNVKRSKELFRKMAEQKWDLVWNAMNVSVFFLDEEMLDLMKASGCIYLSLAIESGSPRVLKQIIHKPVKHDHAIRMAAYARNLGIDTTSLFVIGFPGETWDEIRQTVRFAEEINTDYVKFNVATAFPGTKLHKLAVNTQSIDPNFDFDDVEWGTAGISTEEFSADCLTVLRALEWDRINFATPKKTTKIAQMMCITEEELTVIRRETLRFSLATRPGASI